MAENPRDRFMVRIVYFENDISGQACAGTCHTAMNFLEDNRILNRVSEEITGLSPVFSRPRAVAGSVRGRLE